MFFNLKVLTRQLQVAIAFLIPNQLEHTLLLAFQLLNNFVKMSPFFAI